jgi:hypothetical protein
MIDTVFTVLAALVLLLGAAPSGALEMTPTPASHPPITVEDYRGWPHSYRLTNGQIDAVVLTDIGPRIVALNRTGGPNLFHVRDREAGGRDEAQWVFRGGWRLWVAPERRETTYALDNAACTATVDGSTLRVTGPAQAAAGVQKTIEVTIDPDRPHLHVRSRLRNIDQRPLTYAPWSLSVMRPGGRAFVPLDVGPADAFDATRRLLLWSYAKIADPRYRFGDRLVQIDHPAIGPAPPEQSGRRDDESKIGVDSAQGWGAYLLGDVLYLKRFPHESGGTYPDGGATIEVYSSAEFLELEQLGPLTTIAPGDEIVFPEDWWVFSGVSIPSDEAGALAALQPFIQQTQ